ncbi:hypothetical protein FA15DRAFT_308152 [Coprinopsis marcescibilis]|uniref:Uncharacterized protein n=1 Tax=Coprinopsis marcescibilis TaxID=230819 RepID=A0A5C3KCG5_COPMA|nr:hypothetical protein FA15DRAFT_308152 [Coprinopsis marcescibilis]
MAWRRRCRGRQSLRRLFDAPGLPSPGSVQAGLALQLQLVAWCSLEPQKEQMWLLVVPWVHLSDFPLTFQLIQISASVVGWTSARPARLAQTGWGCFSPLPPWVWMLWPLLPHRTQMKWAGSPEDDAEVGPDADGALSRKDWPPRPLLLPRLALPPFTLSNCLLISSIFLSLSLIFSSASFLASLISAMAAVVDSCKRLQRSHCRLK